MTSKKRKNSLVSAIQLALAVSISSSASAQLFPAEIELSDLDSRNGFIINGESAFDYSGRSVSGAGDVNGDGIDDLIIGTNRTNRSYLLFGSTESRPGQIDLSGLDGTNGFAIDGEPGSRAGHSVSAAGDVNGDGIDDLIIGAPGVGPNGSASGRSHVVFGARSFQRSPLELSSLDGGNGFVLNGENWDDHSGVSVSGGVDVNGDGIDDLIIGADRATPNGLYSGRSYVVFGIAGSRPTSLELSNLDGSNGFALNGEEARDRSGLSVSGVGDVNEDGIDDLVIGAYLSSPNGAESGRSYVVFGAMGTRSTPLELSSLDGSNGFVMNGESLYSYTGRHVSRAGDINGDGIDDLIVGSRNADLKRSSSSYVVFGKETPHPPLLELSSLNGFNGFALNGELDDFLSVHRVSAAGDVNGDGVDDLLIGWPHADKDGIVRTGRSYVVFGRKPVFADGFER